MFTAALIGPDGCGKTTVARRLESALGVPARYVYMGINLESSNLVLPSTWLWLQLRRALGRRPDLAGPPDPARHTKRPQGVARRVFAAGKSHLRLANLLAEEWFRQRVISFHRRRGRIVLLDRDFFADYYAHDVAPPQSAGPRRTMSSRLHGYSLRRFYRRPDLIVFLDAPAELLFERKREGTVERLQGRREEYLRLRESIRHFHTVDATQPLEIVIASVREVILNYRREHVAAAGNGRRAVVSPETTASTHSV